MLTFLVKAQTPSSDNNWNTTTFLFSDDFSGTTINTSNWDVSTSTDHPFDFTTANVTVDNSSGTNCLNLKATNGNLSGQPIHSGEVSTKNTYRYGYYEARCKLASSGSAYLPAFWVWSASNCHCDLGPSGCDTGWYKEIDFFETGCTPHAFNLTSNLHSYDGNCNHNNGVEMFNPYIISGDGLYNDFHTYGYEWTPNKVIFYLDGISYRYLNSSLVSDHALTLVFDLGFTGTIDTTTSSFPGYMYVDYVKIYDLKRDCSIDYTFSSDIHSTTTPFDYKVKKSITLSSYTNNLTSSDKITLRATDYVLISEDFSIPIGAEFTILPTECY